MTKSIFFKVAASKLTNLLSVVSNILARECNFFDIVRIAGI